MSSIEKTRPSMPLRKKLKRIVKTGESNKKYREEESEDQHHSSHLNSKKISTPYNVIVDRQANRSSSNALVVKKATHEIMPRVKKTTTPTALETVALTAESHRAYLQTIALQLEAKLIELLGIPASPVDHDSESESDDYEEEQRDNASNMGVISAIQYSLDENERIITNIKSLVEKLNDL